MGRNKRKHKHLPPRMRFAHGAYFHADARGGRKPWVLLGHTYADAIVKYAQLEARVADRRDFAALVKKFRAEELPRKAETTQKVYATLLKKPLEVFGAVLPADIEPVHAYRFIDERKLASARQEVSVMSSVLSYGVKVGWLRTNPLHGMRFGPANRRKRYITDAELAAILAAAPTEVAHAVSLLHYTALRVSDALRLRWKDWQADGLHVHISKVNKPLVFDRTPGLEALMAELRQRRIGSLYVLADRAGRQWTYDRLLAAWAKVAPEDANLHDLRRKRITDLTRERGIEFAQAIAAHSSPKMTATYFSAERRVAI